MSLDSIQIHRILEDQRQDLRESWSRSTFVEREASGHFAEMLKSKLVSVVLGVRRAGKSTLCLQGVAAEEVGFLNFDDERLIGVGADDLNLIYETLMELHPGCRTLLLDEIQNVEGWELFANRLQRKGVKLIVTGSNAHLLGSELSTHLTGRELSLELFPFSFREYLKFKDQEESAKGDTPEKRALVRRHLEDYAAHGGFPEVIQGEKPGPYLRELFDRIISRDVLQRRALKSSKALKELALYLVQNSGTLASYQKLARMFDFKSVHTLKNYVGFLEETYLIQELQSYSNKLKERLTLPRKIYAIDSGMKRALSTKPTPDRGAELETLVYLQLRRNFRELYYFRNSSAEVDFVLCEKGQPRELIQACWSLIDRKTREREVRSLVHAASALGISRAQIVTWDEEENEIYEGSLRILVLPLWKFLGCRSV